MTIHFNKRTPLQALAICAMLFLASACSKKQDLDAPASVGSSVSTEVNDAYITSKVQEALLASDTIKSFPIKVKTENGEVILSGFVNNLQQVDQSVALTKSVKGVTMVINQLEVKDNSTSSDNKIGDGLVTTTVKTALMNDSLLKSFEISVVTRNGEVLLSGFVDNQAEVVRSVEVAQGVEGVKSVLNHMVVKGS